MIVSRQPSCQFAPQRCFWQIAITWMHGYINGMTPQKLAVVFSCEFSGTQLKVEISWHVESVKSWRICERRLPNFCRHGRMAWGRMLDRVKVEDSLSLSPCGSASCTFRSFDVFAHICTLQEYLSPTFFIPTEHRILEKIMAALRASFESWYVCRCAM